MSNITCNSPSNPLKPLSNALHKSLLNVKFGISDLDMFNVRFGISDLDMFRHFDNMLRFDFIFYKLNLDPFPSDPTCSGLWSI